MRIAERRRPGEERKRCEVDREEGGEAKRHKDVITGERKGSEREDIPPHSLFFYIRMLLLLLLSPSSHEIRGSEPYVIYQK